MHASLPLLAATLLTCNLVSAWGGYDNNYYYQPYGNYNNGWGFSDALQTVPSVNVGVGLGSSSGNSNSNNNGGSSGSGTPSYHGSQQQPSRNNDWWD